MVHVMSCLKVGNDLYNAKVNVDKVHPQTEHARSQDADIELTTIEIEQWIVANESNCSNNEQMITIEDVFQQ